MLSGEETGWGRHKRETKEWGQFSEKTLAASLLSDRWPWVYVACLSFVCNACIVAKPYVVRCRRWYRWI